jgi:hypothetical protein
LCHYNCEVSKNIIFYIFLFFACISKSCRDHHQSPNQCFNLIYCSYRRSDNQEAVELVELSSSQNFRGQRADGTENEKFRNDVENLDDDEETDDYKYIDDDEDTDDDEDHLAFLKGNN